MFLYSRWDECCPHCEEKIKDIYQYFIAHDYSNDFEMECPHCGKNIQVDVHAVPEFEFTKGREKDEEA